MDDVTGNTLVAYYKNMKMPQPIYNKFQNCLIWNNGYRKGKPLIMRISHTFRKPENTGKMARLTIMTDTNYTIFSIT
jgi:hypothetical protein